MKIYLVGGAVRDELLGLPVKEKDWVVIGSTPEDMLKLGYQSVGKDFPVFLHPDTKEEYALARTERKTGPGYKGFVFHAEPTVTLEQDLSRRDLTINAIAKDQETGSLVDPFDGQDDLAAKMLRHVSPAFSEDPVRVLRLARFSARFVDFSIAPETLDLAQSMAQSGEIDALVPERVWQELFKALTYDRPECFFHTLKQCDALAIIFPELDQNEQAIKALSSACQLSSDPIIRFAAMLHCVDDHQSLCKRIRAPKAFVDAAKILYTHHSLLSDISKDKPDGILNLLNSLDAFRRPDRLQTFLNAAQACYEPTQVGQQIDIIKQALPICAQVTFESIDQSLKGADIAKALYEKRLDELKKQ